MAKLADHVFNTAITVLCNGLKRGLKLVTKIGRHTDCVPVQVAVAIVEPFSLGFSNVRASRKGLEPLNQEFMPFHLVEFDTRIKSRRVPVERIGELVRIVPVKGTERGDEKSLTEVLTFGQGKLQLCDPLLLTQVWPLVTTVVDDASLRCSSVAWLYSPDLGTFPAKSPLFSGCTWQLFSGSEKSLLCEVHDGHRT